MPGLPRGQRFSVHLLAVQGVASIEAFPRPAPLILMGGVPAGGEVESERTPRELLDAEGSLTAEYLRKRVGCVHDTTTNGKRMDEWELGRATGGRRIGKCALHRL
jgi:hypothetical protein